MNSLAKFIGGALLAIGVLWAIAALWMLPERFDTFVLRWGGVILMPIGFVLLYHFATRADDARWAQGEWLEASGAIVSYDAEHSMLTLRLRCERFGEFTVHLVEPNSERITAAAKRHAPVRAYVRSNDRRVVELVAVDDVRL
jgi:hypothetical protein